MRPGLQTTQYYMVVAPARTFFPIPSARELIHLLATLAYPHGVRQKGLRRPQPAACVPAIQSCGSRVWDVGESNVWEVRKSRMWDVGGSRVWDVGGSRVWEVGESNV